MGFKSTSDTCVKKKKEKSGIGYHTVEAEQKMELFTPAYQEYELNRYLHFICKIRGVPNPAFSGIGLTSGPDRIQRLLQALIPLIIHVLILKVF